MLFDTDILVWVFRGNSKAATFVEKVDSRFIAIVSYIELLQGARNRAEMKAVKDFVASCAFVVLPLTENIGHRAAIYVEEFGLSAELRLADALIAASAIENNLALGTGNRKHFSCIKELEIVTFRP